MRLILTSDHSGLEEWDFRKTLFKGIMKKLICRIA